MNPREIIKNSRIAKCFIIPGIVATVSFLSFYNGYFYKSELQKQIDKSAVYNHQPNALLEEKLSIQPQKREKIELTIPLTTQQQPTAITPYTDNLESKIVNAVSREIDRSYLNSSSNDEYKTSQYIEYLKEEETFENSFKIRTPKEYEGALSELQTYVTALKNVQLIKAVDTTPLKDLKDYYKPLKELLNELNEIQTNDKFSCYEKLEKMYESISKKIKPGELTKGSLGIEYLINGKLGDCNDISTAYFALFKHYHINCYLKIGKLLESEGCHAWISVDVGDYTIDLDPTFYEQFVPLKDTKMMKKFP